MVASSNADTRPLSLQTPAMAAALRWCRQSLTGSPRGVGPRGAAWGCTAFGRASAAPCMVSSPQGSKVTASGDCELPEDVSFRDVPSDIVQGTVTSGGWIWASALGGAWQHAATQQHVLCSQGQARSLVPQWLTVKALFQVI